MRRLFVVLSVSAALGSGLLAAQPVLASPAQVIQDCTSHQRLTHTYSASELSQALARMPSDVKEYTNCYDVIDQGLSTAIGKGGGGDGSGSGSGGSFLPTPLIVVLVVLVLGAAGFGVVALRKRGAADQ